MDDILLKCGIVFNFRMREQITTLITELLESQEVGNGLYDDLLLTLMFLEHGEGYDINKLIMKYRARLVQNSLSLFDCVRWLLFHRLRPDSVTDFASPFKPRKPINYDETKQSYHAREDAFDWFNFGKVYVAKSQISAKVDTGFGVFAATDFAPNDVITRYHGKYFNTVNSLPDITPYLRKFDGFYIDGDHSYSALESTQIGQLLQDPILTQYVNSKNVALQISEIPEAFREDNWKPTMRMFLFDVATKRIPKGSEIYTSYNYSDPTTYDILHMIPKEPETLSLPPPTPLLILRQ